MKIINRVKRGWAVKEGSKYYINSEKTLSILANNLNMDFILCHKDVFRGILLDAGCGEKPYSLIYDDLVERSIGMDVERCPHDTAAVDVFASIDQMPFEDNKFDVVLCADVLEHVENMEKAVKEIARVLKPKGEVIISVPFLYPVHEMPYDFFRFTRYGLESLMKRNGLKVKILYPLGGPFFLIMVWLYLALSRISKLRLWRGLLARSQEAIYKLYKRTSFRRIVKGNISAISYVVTCGFFMIAEKD